MDFRREESSDSSTEEYEQLKHNSDSSKRSYECTFCRRGFTNAQALGGHMNIHRKDRAKAKQIPHKDYQSDPPKSSSHRFYFQSPPANPHESSDWFVGNSRPLGLTQELLGANLSLGIGTRISDAEVGSRSVWKNDEVDLELRLGHDP